MCKVSVIMPLYNGERYVKRAVDSILNQSFRDFELVVVNDASNDSSRDIILQYDDDRIKLYDNELNQGISYTRNRAIELAKGEYIAIMDDDDIAPLYRLEKEVDYLDRNPDIVAVIGNTCRIDANDNDLNELWRVCKSPKRVNAYFFFGDPVPNSSAMFRKKIVWDNNITFSDKKYGIEDYDFWSRVSLIGLIGSIDEIMLYNRLTHGSESAVQNTVEARKKRRVEYFKIKEAIFRGYNIELSQKEMDTFNNCFSEGRTTASAKELINVFPILLSVIKQTQNSNISGAIRQICLFTYIRTVIKSIKFKITRRNKMWWDYSNRKNEKPKGLQ